MEWELRCLAEAIMTLKTARAKLRLTEIESLADAARPDELAVGVEAANEAGARGDGDAGRSVGSRSASGDGAVLSTARTTAKEGDAMPYRDSGASPTIGEELTQAREAAGLQLDDVAAQLRIRREFLAALEEGRPDALPGVTYAIGYVRTYAAFLGLDVERAVTRFKQEAAGLAQRTQLVFPSPAPEGRVPGLGLVFASVLLAGFAYGGWYWMSERGLSVYDMVPEVPERLAMLIEGQSGAPSVPAPPAPAQRDTAQQAAQTAGSDAPPESSYRAANPTGVPVTARSNAGDGAVTEPAPASPAEVATAGPADATAPAQGGRRETAMASANDPKVSGEAGTRQPGAATIARSGPSATVPADSSADTVSSTDTGASEPVLADAEAELLAGPNVVDGAPAASPPLAAAAPEPTQALAATEPLGSPVPSAPRLSGLIGASEAAVPNPVEKTPVPATIERVVVRATGESWVQVRSAEGTTLFTRVLRSGDVYRVPDRPGLTLATGNAGALEIVVDGKPAPSLGTFGEVVRNIALDPDRLAAGTAIAGRN